MKKLLLLFALAGVLWACNTNDASNGATFKFRINSLTPYEADVSVKPSNNDIYYYFDIIDVKYLTTYFSSLEEYVDEDDCYYLSNKGTFDELVEYGILSRGEDSFVFDKLDMPGTKWVLYAFQVNRNLRRVGKVSYVTFTVPEY